ncbi:MAG: electron transfer flavoprotein subunit beta/FixA family protein [Gammaproteobacteria bacterium]|jgi:electron transfer flavoprotein beta subunit|nr:electron transfer flavoprotein subunit beta/FixA family protein [Gammaproteobacteria bacterium]MBT5216352.1 electron transfer flavoprotein subunit beta/FixA family protein [Gammaproteobacteria bacterium]MBT5541842.1 electron transfer flavoprotein subunit beta/FixA family protein [Gammaproteobacteria bacterium]MBT6074812.1 electron transfer flavoprotein subunit beta/FixA family protein [Gammaproteobacteria bacterium]MBT7754464.1 electron transfer flavoprotein subunit beta/FixA family protein 
MEKILVCIKRVVDYNVKIRIKPDESGVITEGVKMSINPFDEIALEEALRIKENGDANEVIIVSIGPSDCQQQLRTGLAMGADRAILIEHDEIIEPLKVAKLLHKIVQQEKPSIILLGKQAIDDDCNQTGQMLAELCSYSQATFASGLTVDGNCLKVIREVDQGLETVEIDLPAIVTTDLRLNEPRYVKLPDIMKAKKKPMDVIDPNNLGVSLEPSLKVISVTPPPPRESGIMLDGVDDLFTALKDKGLINE